MANAKHVCGRLLVKNTNKGEGLVFDGITITSKKNRSKQVDNLCCVAVDEG